MRHDTTRINNVSRGLDSGISVVRSDIVRYRSVMSGVRMRSPRASGMDFVASDEVSRFESARKRPAALGWLRNSIWSNARCGAVPTSVHRLLHESVRLIHSSGCPPFGF